MILSASPTLPALRGLFLRWTRDHSFGVAIALVSFAIVWMLQVSILSGWHFALPSPAVPFAPVSSAVAADSKANTLTYSFVGAPAVSATRTINVPTDSVLALDVTLDRVPQRTMLTLGWVGTRDRRKPSNLAVSLMPSETEQSIRVMLRGHSHWRDSITQMALVLAAPNGSAPITLSRAEFVSATPGAATSVAFSSWFDAPTQVRSASVSTRTLPLAALVALAALIGFAAIARFKRNAPQKRRDALIGATVALIACTLAFAAFAKHAWSINLTALAWLFASLAIIVSVFDVVPPKVRAIKTPVPISIIVALTLAIVAVALGGWTLSWAIAVVLWSFLARRFQSIATKLRPSVFFLPALTIGALVQAANAKHVELPQRLLADPSSALGNAIHAATALPAIAAILLLVHTFWPRNNESRAYDDNVGVTLWLTLTGSLVAYIWSATLPNSPIGFAWVLLPTLLALLAWLSPRFLAPVSETADALQTSAKGKTEADLSAVVRQLFDGASQSFDAALRSDNAATALAPLKRMREIAGASGITYGAELRYALARGHAREGLAAYDALKSQDRRTHSDTTREALIDYAHRTDDFEYLRALVETLEASERKSRLLAYCRVLGSPSDDAVRIDDALWLLDDAPKPNTLALERVELHLLKDDWQAAQRALAESPVTPQSAQGQTYVARLGMRASGIAAYADQVQKLVTWNNKSALAQTAMGELLLSQQNLPGARARFALALAIEPQLWPLKVRIKQIDHTDPTTDDPAVHAASNV
jgi:hypothetical protein